MSVLDWKCRSILLHNLYGVIKDCDGFAEEPNDCSVIGNVDVLCNFNSSFCAFINGDKTDSAVIRNINISIKGFKDAIKHGKIGRAICFGFDSESNKYALVVNGNTVEEICQFGALEHRMLPVSEFVVRKG